MERSRFGVSADGIVHGGQKEHTVMWVNLRVTELEPCDTVCQNSSKRGCRGRRQASGVGVGTWAQGNLQGDDTSLSGGGRSVAMHVCRTHLHRCARVQEAPRRAKTVTAGACRLAQSPRLACAVWTRDTDRKVAKPSGESQLLPFM